MYTVFFFLHIIFLYTSILTNQDTYGISLFLSLSLCFVKGEGVKNNTNMFLYLIKKSVQPIF